jgi:hypothetical protein
MAFEASRKGEAPRQRFSDEEERRHAIMIAAEIIASAAKDDMTYGTQTAETVWQVGSDRIVTAIEEAERMDLTKEEMEEAKALAKEKLKASLH